MIQKNSITVPFLNKDLPEHATIVSPVMLPQQFGMPLLFLPILQNIVVLDQVYHGDVAR
jgi:hypothetical protein